MIEQIAVVSLKLWVKLVYKFNVLLNSILETLFISSIFIYNESSITIKF